jgi:hypothetical protein
MIVKNLQRVLLGLVLVALPATGFAAVQGSDHDMTGGGQDLCFACHVPHNAQGATLWSRDLTGNPFTGVQAQCYTCHDGNVSTVGLTTVFDAAKEQHAAVGTDCSGGSACHDVHNQNPNGTGKFTVAGVALTNGTYCETCHDATPFTGAEALGDHTAGLTHQTDVGFTCNQCHTIHGATQQTANPAGLTAPILLADNQPGAFYGAFCISCHNGSAPAEAALGTGGVAASDVLDYSMATNDGTETKHPTTSTTGAFPVEGCNKCHDVHDPAGTAYGYLLMADNTDSGYCEGCHDGSQAPGVGANTHPTLVPADVGMNTGLTPPLPWANQIDEDGTVGADWAGATANRMVCESCHSVHRQGNTGVEAEYFLRHENGASNQVCSACHTDN